ncbi:uncharacterized protein TNCV_1075031 [Trichonephila clavipes]|uniref:Uncharacterized protein n=1 Tax=Trichonephila clavipes TaxID=2585209 RepID=A0A8X6VQH2_TRICX|nr:uncharacterized protein TNCV_1075031 [Trichonephila clavipes]
MDPRDVIYTKTRLRTPSMDQLSKRPPHRAIFQQDNARPHTERVSKDCICAVSILSLASPISKFVSNRAYLGSFGKANWASHEFERTRGKGTANVEENVSRHHTETCTRQCPNISHRAFGL